MDINSINALYKTTNIPVSGYGARRGDTSDNSFASVFNAVLGMVGETNTLQNKADAEVLKLALGQSDNTHDLMIAEQKATVALQYTVAVRDKFMDAYKELMNMQI